MPQTTPDGSRYGAFYGWDHPWTARLYEQFNEDHGRYREANTALTQHASLKPGQRVLDFAAGSGRTAEAALPYIGSQGSILCVEPAAAMREMGRQRLADPRIHWTAELPTGPSFDRILCGAALWQLDSWEERFGEFVDLLSPGGALCFNIPALYLGQADDPGGGDDPWLVALPAALAAPHQDEASISGESKSPIEIPRIDQIESELKAAGLRPAHYSFRIRLTQAAYRDWLKIPVLTNRLLPGLEPQERIRQVNKAYGQVPQDSWRWERWLGWAAWKGQD
jgi:ubiquinone/menaquinone biosynthesis C-methylase UbiE